ncbi:MAG: hypothetical protein HQL95_06540 [Magnetococcales bacterium]|nr:hypothetical protein [Magnetococcales bacterium]
MMGQEKNACSSISAVKHNGNHKWLWAMIIGGTLSLGAVFMTWKSAIENDDRDRQATMRLSEEPSTSTIVKNVRVPDSEMPVSLPWKPIDPQGERETNWDQRMALVDQRLKSEDPRGALQELYDLLGCVDIQ